MVRPGTRDERAAAIAARQRGVVTRDQLRQAGVPDRAISRMVASGRLCRLHPGVFGSGHGLLPERGREVAALLAVGNGAMLSHWTAAIWWELLPAPASDGPVHVVVLGRGRSGRPGIRVHETTFLEPRDVRRRHGLPITSPARTLLDLADVLPTRRLERALDEAVGRRLARRSQLEDVVARANGRRGAKRLARLLAGAGTTRTRADSEERLLDLLRRAQLPAPILNHPLHGYEADFYWPDHGLVLEMDSWDWHSGRRAFERDRRKSAVLTAAGLRVTHSTWTQAESEPLAVVARVAQALAAR